MEYTVYNILHVYMGHVVRVVVTDTCTYGYILLW